MSGFFLRQALLGMTVQHRGTAPPWSATQMYQALRVPTSEAHHSSLYCATSAEEPVRVWLAAEGDG
eukprot:14823250-Alexandrium_andersonii.AAC.1